MVIRQLWTQWLYISVRWGDLCEIYNNNPNRGQGFSSGAYAVRVLSAMIEKVQYTMILVLEKVKFLLKSGRTCLQRKRNANTIVRFVIWIYI